MKAGDGKAPRNRIPSPGWQALKWNYLGNVMRSLSQFAIGILLARLLGPEPFGIVAIAWMMLGIGNLFADLGFGAALVQRENLATRDLRFIFTCQMAFAALLTISGVLAAPWIAAYFRKPEATPVIQAMFLLFVIECLGQTAAAVLRRALNFKALQQITIISYLAGYLFVGVPLAWSGLGAWSLVGAQLVQSSLNAFLLIRITSVPLLPSLRRGAPGIVQFGLKVTAANLSSWSISNLDTVFIGRAFGVVDLGLYNRALNLLSAPMSAITSGFQGVLFAACSRTQSDRAQIKRIYLETNAAVAILCFPVFITAAVIPDTIVMAIYGAQWQASVPLITPLALAVMVNALLAIKGPILMAGNRVGIELKNQLVTLLLFVPALLVTIQYSMVAVAWAVLATYLARWMLLAIDTLRFTGATAGEYASTLRIPILFGAGVSIMAAAANSWLSFLSALPRLAAVAAVATITLVSLARVFGGHFLKRNLSTLVAADKLSGPVRRFLNL
jgi:O-antigen/teichoic acid export membrane protein